jgi:hypothetical protein
MALYPSSCVLRLCFDHVPDVDRASDKHAGRHTAMPAQRWIAAWPDGLFHARTLLARANESATLKTR